MNIPGTGIYLRPTLAEQVEGWCGVGFKAREAVRELIHLRMRQTSGKGGGHRAKRRALALSQAQRKPGAC